MAFTQGDPLPDVTTTQTQATTAPDWYSNYLSGLASSGQAAVDAGGVAGFSPLQQQAFSNAPTAIQAGQPALQTATQAATDVATTPFMQNVGQYMNPYTQSVIEEMNRLGQRQFRETLAPGATAGAVGSGQFGSKRGMQVYGNIARDVNRDILGKQAEYLAKGFDAATAAAKAQADLELAASGRLGELSSLAYTQGTGGLNVLSTLGAQEQAQEQAKLDYPMTALKKQADLLRGFTIPTSTTKTSTGPLPGSYYSKSDLETGLGYLTALGGAFTPDAQGRIPANEIWNALKRIPGLGDLFKRIETGLGSISDTPPVDNPDYSDPGFVGDPEIDSSLYEEFNITDPNYDPESPMMDLAMVVFGPDGAMYSSPAAARAAGVYNYNMTSPTGGGADSIVDEAHQMGNDDFYDYGDYSYYD